MLPNVFILWSFLVLPIAMLSQNVLSLGPSVPVSILDTSCSWQLNSV